MESAKKTLRLRRLACQHFIKSWLLVAVWVTVTGALFSWAYFRYHHESRYFYTRQILGQWLCVSRGTAAVLHLSMSSIVFPVSRFMHLAFARLALPKKMPKICTSILMNSRSFHLICAVTLIFASVVHTISHVVNAFNFSNHYNYKYIEVNWGTPGQSPMSLIFTSVVGLSGIGMLLLLIMMALTSMDKARARHYNYFWLSHHLVVPLMGLYLIHPLSHVIKEVSNIEKHDPFKCSNSSYALHLHSGKNFTYSQFDCNDPIFASPTSNAWKWLLFPLVLISLDAILRALSIFKHTSTSSIAMLPGDAFEMTISYSGFKCAPGQYVLLQVPKVSLLEWHPFTIVKCPNSLDGNFSVIIKMRGDWTKKVCSEFLDSFTPSQHEIYEGPVSPRVSIIGPFASPMEQMIKCKNLVCIGAGVGVTPFMAFLKYLVSSRSYLNDIERLKFLWLCPDPSQLLWFSWTLSTLHNQFWELNKPDAFTYCVRVTKNPNLILECIRPVLERQYPVVASRVQRGRPDWDDFFRDVKLEFEGKENVKIFCCGSETLMQEVDFRTSVISSGSTKFQLIREAYS